MQGKLDFWWSAVDSSLSLWCVEYKGLSESRSRSETSSSAALAASEATIGPTSASTKIKNSPFWGFDNYLHWFGSPHRANWGIYNEVEISGCDSSFSVIWSTTEIGIMSSGSDPCAACRWIYRVVSPAEKLRSLTSSIKRCVQCGGAATCRRRGCNDDCTFLSRRLSARFVHCAVARMLASKQEHTTTLYCIKISQGGMAKLSSSMSIQV